MSYGLVLKSLFATLKKMITRSNQTPAVADPFLHDQWQGVWEICDVENVRGPDAIGLHWVMLYESQAISGILEAVSNTIQVDPIVSIETSESDCILSMRSNDRFPALGTVASRSSHVLERLFRMRRRPGSDRRL